MGWSDFNFGADDDPDLRKSAVDRHLGRVGLSLTTKDILGGAPETQAERDRKARKAAEQLAKEDRLFGVVRGATIGVPFTAGDKDADGLDDADRELASMEQERR